MKVRFRRLFTKPIDEILNDIRESMREFTSEEYTSEDFSNILFNRLIGNGISGRIISYTISNQLFYSVQYYRRNKWVNFNYEGLDLFFHPVYNKTLNPTNIIEEGDGY